MDTATTRDIPRTARSEPRITIYGPKECPNCGQAMAFFDRNSIAYTTVCIEAGDTDHRYITEELGYSAAPVIIVDINHDTGAGQRTVHWGGHRMDMLVAVRSLVMNIRTHEAPDADEALSA